jgi:hypothetical protein
MKKILLFSILFITGMTSCDNDEKYSIEIDKESIIVDFKGGEEVIKVTSNGYWQIRDIPSWVTINPSYGEYAADIILAIDRNEGDDQRSGSLVFTCGDASRILTIRQLSITDLPPFIETDKEQLYISSEGGEQKIKLTTNRAWKISPIPRWITITPVNGDRSTEITIKVEENRQPEERKVDFVISAENVTKAVNITQPGLRDVIWGPVLPVFSFKKVSFSIELKNYEIEAKSLFVNPNIKDKIFLGSLISHNPGSNTTIPAFTGYTFNPVTVHTSAVVQEATATFLPSPEAQAVFAKDILAQDPEQQQSFFADKRGSEFYTYKQLHTVGMINIGVKLDELVSGSPFTRQEMIKRYGIIFSFKQILFSIDMDIPEKLIREEMSEADLAKGVSYVSSVSYGRIGLLIVESNTDSRDLRVLINKVLENETLTTAETATIQSAEISHVCFTNDNEVKIKKGGLDAIESYKEAILNTNDNVYPVDFSLNNFTDHSESILSFLFTTPE